MSGALPQPVISILGQDPPRIHRINANSFQQSAIVTVKGWQYAALYTSKHGKEDSNVCYITVGRRKVHSTANSEIESAEWEFISFGDYQQTIDDGHNTISLGVCTGDGTIQMSFDHHCDRLRFRSSVAEVATEPQKHVWSTALFGKMEHTLPGLEASEIMEEVTYPRFVNIDKDMILSYRLGQAGLGSDVLYHYSHKTHNYEYLGTHLTGVGNSPYVNGIDYKLGRIHLSWTYRRFIEYDGVFDKSSTVHKVQAGPNGPENNYTLSYMYSDNSGQSWCNSAGKTISEGKSSTVLPTTEGIVVFDLPTQSGILNQEAQAADAIGGFHVLNRENLSGKEEWMVYTRNRLGPWKKTPIFGLHPMEAGARGSICADMESNLYVILPGNTDSSLTVLRAFKSQNHDHFEIVWRGDGFDGEPLIDHGRLDESSVLSIFTRTSKDENGNRKVIVLDFNLSQG
ncbi:hypothetical protein AOQ84DRAFT_300473 [Glonium stellatum]|uniref:Dockerin type 1 n=1 Tax=Glonium stellatum TaxID=574774 RepID=A0A8E2JPU0_9PEZI|nr:hypothetical protein AOQ84DRAFT_300473 [Glonium stellatum]